jgi:hypothetical protein
MRDKACVNCAQAPAALQLYSLAAPENICVSGSKRDAMGGHALQDSTVPQEIPLSAGSLLVGAVLTVLLDKTDGVVLCG